MSARVSKKGNDLEDLFTFSKWAVRLRLIAITITILLISGVVIADIVNPTWDPDIAIVALLVGLLMALLNIKAGANILFAILGRSGFGPQGQGGMYGGYGGYGGGYDPYGGGMTPPVQPGVPDPMDPTGGGTNAGSGPIPPI